MRELLDSRMLNIHEKLLRMSTLVEENIEDAMKALVDQDVELAVEIVEKDLDINVYESEIENLCVSLVATQNPVGSDLRKVFSVLKIVTDLERIGDHAVNIAKVVIDLGKYNVLKPLVDIPKMGDDVKKMVYSSINSFVDEDIQLAKETALCDEAIDKKYYEVYRELVGYLKEPAGDENQIIGLLLVGRYLERIADHSTNICERVI